jgi:Transposase DDE domain group 1
MSEDSTTQCLLFPGIFRKPVVAQFDQREGSSDGGALLLKAADRHYGLVAGLASCLRDERQAGKVDHSLRELVAQRVFSIACGYPDANDSARLSEDPIHKLLVDRDPIEGRDLASQPTLSRFENGVGVKELYRVGEFLAESVLRRHAKRLRHRAYRVTIDLDPTDDPTHGAQQLSFFNGHYDTWCYLPVMGFVSFNDEAEQYLCAAVLRPGNVTAAAGAVAILRRLVRMIRHHIPGVQIRVRLDGGFAHPAVLEFLDAQPKLEYVVAMAKNSVLKRVAESGMRRARQLSRRSGKTEHIYGEVRYKAGKWPRLRRVIIKAEVVRAADKDPRDNPRFVITNMKQSPQWIYEHVYCQRGDVENRIKELHDLDIDRTSCTSFWANQFRVLLTAAAYVLMQELRLRAAGTACARAQVGMLRERLLKLGARVLVSVRRVVVHLPASFPFLPTFHRVALALGAATG